MFFHRLQLATVSSMEQFGPRALTQQKISSLAIKMASASVVITSLGKIAARAHQRIGMLRQEEAVKNADVIQLGQLTDSVI